MTEPTDAELWQLHMQMPGVHKDPIDFARAVLAKWGTPPAVAGEPALHQYQASDGTWKDFDSERHRLDTVAAGYPVRTLYTVTQAQAGAVPLTDEQIDAAAKKLAECMEYPWEFMPEPGRENMRKHAQAVIAAANGIKGGQHG